MDKSTVTFNVGGQEFAISRTCLYKSVKLTELSVRAPETLFLDYNYDAFAIALDFLRHGRALVPPTVNGTTVELILDDLGVPLTRAQRQGLSKRRTISNFFTFNDPLNEDGPPEYSPSVVSEKQKSALQNSKQSDASNLSDQLAITVHQKIADLIISTIHPRIASQALQGAYRTTYVLLPANIKDETMMSEFPNSKFTEIVRLDKDAEKFLGQPEVLRRFESALRQSLDVPMSMMKKDVFFRSENEFGILGTETVEALVIDFELL
jgi:hypothetical protein